MRASEETRLERLKPGRPVAGRLAAGEARSYRLVLEEGDYVRFELEQLGDDLLVRLFDPAGALVTEADLLISLHAAEVGEAVASASGRYRLEVACWCRSEADFRLLLAERRPATADDRQRTEAAEAARLAFQPDLREGSLSDAELAEAETAARQALELWRRAGNADGEGWALNTLGRVVGFRGSPQAALELYLEAVAVWRASGNAYGEATALHNVGRELWRLGRPEEAAEEYERAIELWRREQTPAKEANTLINAGIVYRQLGRLEQARQAYRRAAELAQKSGDVVMQARALTSEGALLRDQGEAREAIALHRQALEGLARHPSVPLEILVESNLGACYGDLGDDQEALDHYARATELADRLDVRTSELAVVLHNLGSRYVELGDRERAGRSFERALEISRRIHWRDTEADALASLGSLLEEEGRLEDARRLIGESLAISENAADLRRVASRKIQLGRVLEGLDEGSAARGSFERALALATELGDPRLEAEALCDLGRLAVEAGELEGARPLLDQALALAEEQEDPLLELYGRQVLARLENEAGRPVRALDHARRAVTLLETRRSGLLDRTLRMSFRARHQATYGRAIGLLVELGPDYAAEAVEMSERARAQGLAELLAEASRQVRRSLRPELRAAEEDRVARISALQRRLVDLERDERAASDFETRRAALRGEIDETRRSLADLEVEARRSSPELAGLTYPEPLGLADVQARLPEGSALLEYFVGLREVYLLAVAADGVEAASLGPVEEIRPRVEAVRAGLEPESGASLTGLHLDLAELHERLVAPARRIVEDAEHLIVVPDGFLYDLPFEVLVTEEPSRTAAPSYLLSRHLVSYVPSATVLDRIDRLDREGGARRAPVDETDRLDLFALADPVFLRAEASDPSEGDRSVGVSAPAGGAETWRYPPLEAARDEVRGIAGLFPADRTEVLEREEATEESVKQAAGVRQARYLHFATHARTDVESPFLLLARGDDGGEDGLLELHEIFNLRLAADLVVLSACSTGTGRTVRGEGVIGFSQAFLYAGSPSLVVSLWKVEDRATAELMVRFYRRLVGGSPKAAALREAKLAMLEAGYRHPGFWAPFVLVGSAR